MSLAGARRYIERGLTTIPGWLGRFDAQLFVLIQESQQEAGIVGDVLEIGVYLGRSAALLGYFVRPEERFVACDLFAGHEADHHLESDLSAFKSNYLRFHSSLPDIRVGLSSQLSSEPANAFRFIYVDGSHTFEEVANDIRIVQRLARPGAVLVFDDVRAREYPGVAAAVWPAVASQTIVPFALTNKLYCTAHGEPEYLERLLQFTRGNRSLRTTIHPIAGHDVISLSPSPESAAKRVTRDLVPPALLRHVKRLLT